MYVSRRGEQVQLFAREYRHARDVNDTNDDIVFNEGDARDDGDKLTTFSAAGVRAKIERRKITQGGGGGDVRSVHPDLFVRKMYLHALAGNRNISVKVQRNMQRGNLSFKFISFIYNFANKYYSNKKVLFRKTR